MAVKKKALGRGLDALIGQVQQPRDTDSASELKLRQIPVDMITPGRYQPRSVFDQDKLDELAESIKAQGVVQPVVVHKNPDGSYELIAGERRWRAAQLAGLEEIPAVVRRVEDEAILPMSLIENIQREDLNPLEQARALRRLIEEFGMTHQQAGAAVGRSRTAITNQLRLLLLTDKVKQLIDQQQLEMGHARALLALPEQDQFKTAKTIVSRALSVRQTERLVKRMLAGKPARRPTPVNADVQRLENQLTEQLGARVAIKHQASGKGQLTIQYNSLDELDGILEHIK